MYSYVLAYTEKYVKDNAINNKGRQAIRKQSNYKICNYQLGSGN